MVQLSILRTLKIIPIVCKYLNYNIELWSSGWINWNLKAYFVTEKKVPTFTFLSTRAYKSDVDLGAS